MVLVDGGGHQVEMVVMGGGHGRGGYEGGDGEHGRDGHQGGDGGCSSGGDGSRWQQWWW